MDLWLHRAFITVAIVLMLVIIWVLLDDNSLVLKVG